MESQIPQNTLHGDPAFSLHEYHNCLQQAADYVLHRLNIDKIDLAIVEGSGMLDLSHHLFKDLQITEISMHDIPHCPIPTAIGHKQELLYAVMQGRRTLIFNGRIHYYEGYRVHQQAFPAFLSAYMSCSVFITTNAAGFINQGMKIGDLALITDHISMINKAYDGLASLDYQLFNKGGLKSSNEIQDHELINLTRQSFLDTGVKLTEGPYCYFALPNYESPAEIQIMHGLGSATVGASTLPEQVACYMAGMRRVVISSATSPSAGMSAEAIDGEEVLLGGKICVANFAKVIPNLVGKLGDQWFQRERPKNLSGLLASASKSALRLQRQEVDGQAIAEKLVKVIQAKIGGAKVKQANWLMSSTLATQFGQVFSAKTVYFINLKDIASLRTRSFEEGSIFIGIDKDGQIILGIRQPYLEGMLPYEYSIILKALKTLGVSTINIYLEASSISDDSLNGHVHKVSHYYNKRFYKHTETGRDYHPEPKPTQEEGGRSLFVSEGNMLPSRTELNFAKKCRLDLYTITNLSVLEIAEYLSIRPNVYAVAKQDLGNADETVQEFTTQSAHFEGGQTVAQVADEPTIKRREVAVGYAATFDVSHSKDGIYETAAKVKEVIGLVDNVVVLERETFEVLFTDLATQFTVEKAVKLNLKDYKNEERSVGLIKIVSKEGLPVLVISETLNYQSHVPFQTLLLPMRITIIGCESKNFVSCPHIWNLQSRLNPEPLTAGDLFIVRDHANISAQSPGIGPNIDEYGPRFYDISQMYEKRFTALLQEAVSSTGAKHAEGQVFWVNNSAVPSPVYAQMAEGLSNEKVTFKGMLKSGVSELMAVHHRASPYKLTSAMVGIVTDSTVRRQEQHERYVAGVERLAAAVFGGFSRLQAV
ncbi:hypothetical protein FGO68_gene11754 [Halteria grandinella]|uniref:purine-nucleoside phosphorylase n=1 Tax=Halteria grandinella TaxID=5974 RepID=A0A8J8T6T0_HALGN|nr:hypothetical protein FGO68_gene11754 [Halteria grandinella]